MLYHGHGNDVTDRIYLPIHPIFVVVATHTKATTISRVETNPTITPATITITITDSVAASRRAATTDVEKCAVCNSEMRERESERERESLKCIF